ncbi:hypothetical protein Taro_056017 [Colocasia esculenta]|uniref:Uncharacterized protein n=1 Tax=Colocasia esculenta TaxID=4460 RepID=A0A843XW22_COLES|nr:hypothetical protein [Colocasia esculenta]
MHVGLDTDVYKSTGIVPCSGTFSSSREHALILRNPLPRKFSTDLGIGGFPRSSPGPTDPLLVLQVFVLTGDRLPFLSSGGRFGSGPNRIIPPQLPKKYSLSWYIAPFSNVVQTTH